MFREYDFHYIRTIGTGTFSRVYAVKHKINRKYFAIKCMDKRMLLKKRQIENIFNEKNILQKCWGCPFIVKLYDIIVTENKYLMIFNYVSGGELFTWLKHFERFDIDAARFYTSELVLALEYLHDKGIAYRDLKPENILLNASGHIVLTDFGFARYINKVNYEPCGTPDYMAPELLGKNGHNLQVDCWALGIVVYEMVVGSPPFHDSSNYEIYKNILSKKLIKPRGYFLKEKGRACYEFISWLINREIKKRPISAKAMKTHRWFKGVDWVKVSKLECTPPIKPYMKYEGDTNNYPLYPEDDLENLMDKQLHESKPIHFRFIK
ncbi:cAMP-dependent protein kinase catalytic subunit [Astathelohania contejeani]|uniref:cAMP-dependent protein kinase n=1 Tax=Astathelohania contejeani TaxID=164912 RepID=A0ABQ7HWN6_9MICR|nr:cAMP-dependent protein kinase catalytic subunit [Thelohania contejeani]